jgi:hypothetical protein
VQILAAPVPEVQVAAAADAGCWFEMIADDEINSISKSGRMIVARQPILDKAIFALLSSITEKPAKAGIALESANLLSEILGL